MSEKTFMVLLTVSIVLVLLQSIMMSLLETRCKTYENLLKRRGYKTLRRVKLSGVPVWTKTGYRLPFIKDVKKLINEDCNKDFKQCEYKDDCETMESCQKIASLQEHLPDEG